MQEVKDDKIRCTNRKCWRVSTDFIGKMGKVVKTCIKCREKDALKKDTPEAREKKNARNRENKYYIASREKKRAQDEEAFLKHNAAVMKTWRKNTVNEPEN